tara:strand:- start:97 stop:336 length:240 start_codon:yes stop_codon:yes gene_type:complete
MKTLPKEQKQYKLSKLIRKYYRLRGMPDDREREIQIQILLGKIKSYPFNKIKLAVMKEKETATGLYEMYLDLILITGEI